jgi:hypothetical protein
MVAQDKQCSSGSDVRIQTVIGVVGTCNAGSLHQRMNTTVAAYQSGCFLGV